MSAHIFVTGGGGFIGQALLSRMAGKPICTHALVRRPAAPVAGVEYVLGDILNPGSYEAAFRTTDTIIHLAAATGKATPAQYRLSNVEGTRTLLKTAKAAGVKNFLYVSTIAAGYSDQRHYSYAQTKAEAENLVRESGLAFTIIRPTLVLGSASPIWATLQRVARLPIIPLPQGERPVRVQPVHADDVVRAIEIVLDRQHFDGETLDVGGVDSERFDYFLNAVRRQIVGKSAPVIRAPLALARFPLAMVEPVARPFLPVTAGQMALFANDSIAKPNWLMTALQPSLPTTAALLEKLAPRASAQRNLGASTQDDEARLALEARLFTRYLAGIESTADVERHYAAACVQRALSNDMTFSPFDREALALARKGAWFARCADAFCSFFSRGGALRRKLIVLTALIESVSPTNELYDGTRSPGKIGAFALLVARGFSFATAFISGIVMLGLARATKSAQA
ncbi:MAG: NAD-dependent epimerase/dehydratase family protein [Caulobacterales bacterium]